MLAREAFEKVGVGMEVDVNNSYCSSSDEMTNASRVEMESVVQQFTNITALKERLPINFSFP